MDREIAEYALEDYGKPISEYRHAESLPERLQARLPNVEELESELGSGGKRAFLKDFRQYTSESGCFRAQCLSSMPCHRQACTRLFQGDVSTSQNRSTSSIQ